MPGRETADQIDDAASEWAARLDRGLSGDEQTALEDWLTADSRRVGALARARALWCHAGLAGQTAGSAPVPSPFPSAAPITRRRLFAGAAAVAAGAAFVIWTRRTAPVELASGIGEVRRIALEDGSAVTLGAGTRLLRAFSATERRIVMTAGEAFFEVAQDPLRPFVVVARDLTVRAVTTAFNLRMLDGLPLAVAVERGRVSVALAGLRTPTVLEANMRLDLPGDAAPARATVVMMEPDALQRTLAWRDGMLAFEGDALAAVAAQFDRYGPVRIEIADPSLAREPITGLFAANDPRGFARTAAASLGARVETDGNVVRLRRTGPPRE